MKINHIKTRGSIALINIIIIAAFTMILVLNMSQVNISTSYQQLNKSSNQTSSYIAEGCLEEAIKRIEDDITFTTTTINFDDTTRCTATISGDIISINTTFLDYTQNYEAQVSIVQNGQANNVKLLKWTEI